MLGSIANDKLAGSIANAKLANSTITVTDGSNSTDTALEAQLLFLQEKVLMCQKVRHNHSFTEDATDTIKVLQVLIQQTLAYLLRCDSKRRKNSRYRWCNGNRKY